MRLLLATLVVLALVFVGVTLFTGGTDRQSPSPATPRSGADASRQVIAPKLTAEQINRQDPPDRRRQRHEARAFDRRPLLNALPTTVHGVRFDIGGLDHDGRTTLVVADRRGLRLRQVRAAYDTLRRRTGDRSGAYRLVIQP